jgi:hypothetical protein
MRGLYLKTQRTSTINNVQGATTSLLTRDFFRLRFFVLLCVAVLGPYNSACRAELSFRCFSASYLAMYESNGRSSSKVNLSTPSFFLDGATAPDIVVNDRESKSSNTIVV